MIDGRFLKRAYDKLEDVLNYLQVISVVLLTFLLSHSQQQTENFSAHGCCSIWGQISFSLQNKRSIKSMYELKKKWEEMGQIIIFLIGKTISVEPLKK